jgi:phage terminase large subunit-like protein
MLANLPKRPLADPWALETTTAPEPGGGSVAESTMEYARQVLNGKATNPRLFFFHRQASDEHDLSTREGCKAAIVEASGPYVAEWSNIDSIADAFEEPDADRAYLERVWTNRLVQSTGRAFDIDQWRRLLRPDYRPAAGVAICLGFDGSRYDDATSLVGVEVESGHLFTLGVWPAPAIAHLPKEEADAVANAWVLEIAGAVDDAFATYHVCRMYCDPPKWESWISKWAGQYGDKVVVEWWTNRRRQMAYAIRSFITALMGSELTHDGDAQLDEHVANARQSPTGLVDEDDKPLWVLKKERPNSPKKIDAAMAAVLSWEARNDAVAAGEGEVAEYELLIAG